MSATDELQQMLDERGVDYTWTDLRRSIPSREIVQWWPNDDVRAEYIEYHDGSTVLRIHTSMLHATPAQAIAATLGAGTCHNVHESPRNTTFWPTPHFKCSECGATHVSMEYVFYCPNCGRRVVEVDE